MDDVLITMWPLMAWIWSTAHVSSLHVIMVMEVVPLLLMALSLEQPWVFVCCNSWCYDFWKIIAYRWNIVHRYPFEWKSLIESSLIHHLNFAVSNFCQQTRELNVWLAYNFIEFVELQFPLQRRPCHAVFCLLVVRSYPLPVFLKLWP